MECEEEGEEDGEDNGTEREAVDTAGSGISEVRLPESTNSTYQLHEGTVMFEGTETGVKLISSGTVRRDATAS